MKHIFTLLCCIVLSITSYAKTTYIPSYKSWLAVFENGKTDSISGNAREISIPALQGKVMVYIEQEPVSSDRVKAIKRSQRAKNLAGFAMVTSAVSGALKPNYDARGIINATENYHNAQATGQAAEASNEDLKTLPIDIYIENNSDEELTINDMERGLIWYIEPHGSLVIPIDNPTLKNKYRLAFAGNTLPDVSYLYARAESTVKKQDIEYEDDDVWILPRCRKETRSDGSIQQTVIGGVVINKESMQTVQELDAQGLKEFKKTHKQ